MKLETWPLERLIPYAGNPRKNDHAVAAMAKAIKAFGFRVPVLAKSDGAIIDGHLRLKAARAAGLTEVPVILADDMTAEQIKAFRISVNRMAELADWDMDLLKAELEELENMCVDLSLTGLSLDVFPEFAPALDKMPLLPSADKSPFQQMTFTLHDTQAEDVSRALAAAKKQGPFVNTVNENSNGNALTRICEFYLSRGGK